MLQILLEGTELDSNWLYMNIAQKIQMIPGVNIKLTKMLIRKDEFFMHTDNTAKSICQLAVCVVFCFKILFCCHVFMTCKISKLPTNR